MLMLSWVEVSRWSIQFEMLISSTQINYKAFELYWVIRVILGLFDKKFKTRIQYKQIVYDVFGYVFI